MSSKKNRDIPGVRENHESRLQSFHQPSFLGRPHPLSIHTPEELGMEPSPAHPSPNSTPTTFEYQEFSPKNSIKTKHSPKTFSKLMPMGPNVKECLSNQVHDRVAQSDTIQLLSSIISNSCNKTKEPNPTLEKNINHQRSSNYKTTTANPQPHTTTQESMVFFPPRNLPHSRQRS